MSLFDDDPPIEGGTTRRPRGARPEPRPKAVPKAPAPKVGPTVMSVSDLTSEVSARLSALGRVAVEGEIGGLKRASSGHLYFTLKDKGAAVSSVIWRSQVARAGRLEEGAKVVCHGRIDVYAPRGSYSLIVERVEQRGIGALLMQLEELKKQLHAKGWFERVRPLPTLPRVVGVVTSRESDAFQDFLRTRSLRWPGYPLRLAHTKVQGAGAASEIARAIARLDASGVDVICLVRGGGSLEDLWSFNELPVAEAIHAASVPVVVGVGHQTDVTLADHMADHRAHTPTDAAQTVLPDRATLSQALERAGGYLFESMDRALDRRAERLRDLGQRRVLREAGWMLDDRRARLEGLAQRQRHALLQRAQSMETKLARLAQILQRESPRAALAKRETLLVALTGRLANAPERLVTARSSKLEVAAKGLASTSPFAVLGRGYSITRRVADGRAVRSASDVQPGDALETLLDAGALRSVVEQATEGPQRSAGPNLEGEE